MTPTAAMLATMPARIDNAENARYAAMQRLGGDAPHETEWLRRMYRIETYLADRAER